MPTEDLGRPTTVSCTPDEHIEMWDCAVKDEHLTEESTSHVTVHDVELYAGDSDHHLQQIRSFKSSYSYDDGGFRLNLHGTMECEHVDDEYEGRKLVCRAPE